MSLSIDTVFVWVTELDRAVEWYQMIGIEPGPRFGAWQTMTADGETRFALHQGEREKGPATAVIAFAVSDLAAEIERLEQAGLRPIEEITSTGAARFTTYSDPDGNQIQLLERKG